MAIRKTRPFSRRTVATTRAVAVSILTTSIPLRFLSPDQFADLALQVEQFQFAGRSVRLMAVAQDEASDLGALVDADGRERSA